VANDATFSGTATLAATGGEERGILLFLLVAGVEEASLDALDEKRRRSCSKAWQALRAEGAEGQARIQDEWLREARSALPRGLERLHPSWIHAALAGEPTYLLRALGNGLPESVQAVVAELLDEDAENDLTADARLCLATGIQRDIERLAFGWLAPLCEGACGPSAEELCHLQFEDLLAEATRRGARTLGLSLAGAAPGLRARAMASAGEPWGRVIGEASLETVSSAERAAAANHAQTSIPPSARTAGVRLLHIGLVALKSELAAENPGSIFRVAGRLPAALGRPLLGW
jgi:hypothetical protein